MYKDTYLSTICNSFFNIHIYPEYLASLQNGLISLEFILIFRNVFDINMAFVLTMMDLSILHSPVLSLLL